MNEQLLEILEDHEGLKLFLYEDTAHKLSIGIGRNLTDRGISREEALFLCTNDINESIMELKHYDWFNKLDNVRQGVLIELHFNIGLPDLLKFRNMILAIEKGDYPLAVTHLLNSKWAQEVGVNRSLNMANRLRYGTY